MPRHPVPLHAWRPRLAVHICYALDLRWHPGHRPHYLASHRKRQASSSTLPQSSHQNMSTNSVRVFRASLGCLVALGLGGAADTRAPAQLTLDLATLHAAALSTARNPADSSDAPYLLVSIVGTGGQTETDELPKSGRYEVGSLAMANAGPNTNGSQFFICVADLSGRLPKSYTIFGQVTKGMDVVDKIVAAPRNSRDMPDAPVAMTSVTVAED